MKSIVTAVVSAIAGSAALTAMATLYLTALDLPIQTGAYAAPLLMGALLGVVYDRLRVQTQSVKSRLIHLNLVLKTIRDLNHLITREKDRHLLMQGICDTLVENRGYHSAWIALRDKDGNWDHFTESGVGQHFRLLRHRLQKGDGLACCQRALTQPDIVVTDQPTTLCGDCPLVDHYGDRGALSSRLKYNGKIYGVITLSIPKDLVMDTEEQELVLEIAADIAHGLFNLEIQEQREQTEKELRVSMESLRERVKELNCLFGLSRLIEKRGSALDDIFTQVVELIPPAWQYPDITCARIRFNGQQFASAGFQETEWCLEEDIWAGDRKVGSITVAYLIEMPPRDEGPFLNEERSLVAVIAERLGKTIERNRSNEALRSSEMRFRTLIENSLTGISIVQDKQVVYQNQEQARLLGALPRSYILGDFDHIHPDDVDKVKTLSHQIFSGQINSLDVDFRYAPDGDLSHPIWIHCRAHVIEYRQKPAVLVNMMDMTQIKMLEHMLIVQDRMASLGRVAAGIAHEIRNPLSGINIYLDTLQKMIRKGESDENLQNVAHHISSASRKIESVIRRVMDFSKPGKPNFVVGDINQAVEEAIKLTSVTLRKSGISLEQTLFEELPSCRFDPQQIEEVVLNLLNNAVDAMRSTREKRIEVSTAGNEHGVILKVLDSGPGIPMENKYEVFDPFYTSKSDSTGIGLSICHRIINDHGGSIDIRTSRWGGAEFCISLPIAAEAPAP